MRETASDEVCDLTRETSTWSAFSGCAGTSSAQTARTSSLTATLRGAASVSTASRSPPRPFGTSRPCQVTPSRRVRSGPLTSGCRLPPSGALLRAVSLYREGDGRVARGARLLLGQGAVGGPEAQGEGERLATLADLRSGVDVEEAHRLAERSRALSQRRGQLP